MTDILTLPHGANDVLAMPANRIPDAISALVKRREFSGLVCSIHEDMRSGDAGRRERGARALERLGFAE